MERNCMVGDRKAVFHRWIDDERLLIKSNSIAFISDSDIIPPCAGVEKITNTLALVEFCDGTIKKVNPELIRFIK